MFSSDDSIQIKEKIVFASEMDVNPGEKKLRRNRNKIDEITEYTTMF